METILATPARPPTVPRGRRAYALTAPPSLLKKQGEALKRGAPTIWELQSSMESHFERQDALPAAPATWGRAQGAEMLERFREDLSDSESSSACPSRSESDMERERAAASSWPRVRKQRTGVRGSMNLWEVSEALDSAGAPPPSLPSPGSLDTAALDALGHNLSEVIDSVFFTQNSGTAPAPSREDSIGVTALGFDLSKISCGATSDAPEAGPAQLAHQTPRAPLPPDNLPPPHPHDWDKLAQDSPTSDDAYRNDDELMADVFGAANSAALASSEPEALALLQAIADQNKASGDGTAAQQQMHGVGELGGGRSARPGPVLQPPAHGKPPAHSAGSAAALDDMEQAMHMDPGELLASLLPDARGEDGGWQEEMPNGLPSPSTLVRAAGPRCAVAGADGGATRPPLVPHSAELPRPGLVLAPSTTIPLGPHDLSAGAFGADAFGADAFGADAFGADAFPAAADAAAAAAAAANAVGLSIEGGQLVAAASVAGSRNGPERKEWTAAEDEIIQSGVAMFGCKWRRIAAQLPGRSDDAVRNRWNRLKEPRDPSAEGAEGEPAPRRRSSGGGRKEKAAASPEGAAAAGAAPVDGGAAAKGAKPERMSWTKVEDATIISGVQELGHKWYQIAQRLPGRTDHAIRNRYHRLQAMMQDQQQQASSAPMSVLGGPPLEALHEEPMGAARAAALDDDLSGFE